MLRCQILPYLFSVTSGILSDNLPTNLFVALDGIPTKSSDEPTILHLENFHEFPSVGPSSGGLPTKNYVVSEDVPT